jgi:Reverse transcriptase (RNA-dependent DNA polymerase)
VGVRKQHGTLDAVFCLNRLINKARWQHLYVVFIVDFKKTFDQVRRDVLVERCSQLGVHGPFLAAMTMLYDKVKKQVCVDGHLGPSFDTFVGTKQGSELSPLPFGIFMDLLHELIVMQVVSAGPVVGTVRVPNIDSVDDVTTVIAAINDWNQAQELLYCLELFCADLFGMEVNTALNKTCAVVFRKPAWVSLGGYY